MIGAATAAGLLAGCSDPVATDGALASSVQANRETAQHTPAAARPVAASVEWNETARGTIARNSANAFVAFRLLTLVSVAQRDAVDAVEAAAGAGERGHRVSRRAAVAAASAVVLGTMFPVEKANVENRLREQLASADWLENGRVDAAQGEALGRAAAAGVMAAAATDGFADAWRGTLPAPGPSVWFGVPGAPPGGATLVDARTWFLTSPAQFRLGAHPAFGSRQFTRDLAEVRAFSEERKAGTPQGRMMDSIAKFWAFGAGTYTPAGYWNDVASSLATSHHFTERRAADFLATLNMVGWDAIIASNDSKYAYWLLRPSQADPTITLAIVPLPNFPSYPSNHATISSAMAEVIGDAFPSQRGRMRAQAEQAALSRIYGGIHYRFDGDAGIALGKQVAMWALVHSKDGHPVDVLASR